MMNCFVKGTLTFVGHGCRAFVLIRNSKGLFRAQINRKCQVATSESESRVRSQLMIVSSSSNMQCNIFSSTGPQTNNKQRNTPD